MLPIDERLAASALYQSAGMSSQSAQRRYWQNRFRFGQQRTMSNQVGSSQSASAQDGLNMTAPGSIPWTPSAPMNAPINPLMPLPARPAAFGAPRDLMGTQRYMPGVGPNPLTQPDEGAGQIPQFYQEPPRPAGDNPYYEDTARGQWESDVQRYGVTEGRSPSDYTTRSSRGPR